MTADADRGDAGDHTAAYIWLFLGPSRTFLRRLGILGLDRGRKTGTGRLRRRTMGAGRRVPRHPLGATRWAAQHRPARKWVRALPGGAHGVGGDDVRNLLGPRTFAK